MLSAQGLSPRSSGWSAAGTVRGGERTIDIGLLSQWFAPEPGGALVPTVLASGLRARGHDVGVLTGFPNYPQGRIYDGYAQRWRGAETLPDGVRVHRVPLYPSHDGRALTRGLNYLSFAASAASAARSALRDRDCLWVYNSPATVPLVAAHERRRRGLPYLLHIMDVWPDSVLDSGMVAGRAGRTVGSGLDRIVGRGYDHASRIAVTSRGQADLLVSRGVPAAKVEYCPVWVDEDVFFARPHDRTVLPDAVREQGRIVMYAGAIGHVQQLDVAVRAAAAVADTGLQLVLVGSGIAEDGLRDLVRELGATNVHLLGRRPPEEMGLLGAAADAHLVSLADTPLLRITMPSKLPAVLAMERPVVMFGSGDAADVVRDAGAGVTATDLAGLTDAFRCLATAPDEQLAGWASAGRRRYEQEFSLARGLTAVEDMLAGMSRA
jgi:colanic acid biosynthesis glycosyl transferase WcaI